VRIVRICLSALLLCTCVCAQELTDEEKAALEKMEQAYTQDNTTASAQHAWFLYRTGDSSNWRKADSVLLGFIALQDADPESPTYGQWEWKLEGSLRTGDLNKALFRADIMLGKLWEQQSRMSDATRARFLESCRHLTEAAIRRWDTEVFDIGRDHVCYSNIFVLYIETLMMAGERFDDARLKRMGKSQWTRWYNHVSYFGIDEFASPTYNFVIFTHLQNIHRFCHDVRIEKECMEMLNHVYLLQSAITHPLLKIPVCGISRDYRLFLIQDDARSEVLTTPVAGYEPPPEALEMNQQRTYPFEVIGKAGIMPFIFKSYQLEDAGMGSMTGGNVFQQQIHCMAVTGRNEKERAVLFVQGSNTPVNGYTDQREMSALCVYNHLPSYWHLTQWRGDIARYRSTFDEFGVGITANWQEKLNETGHIVLSANGYDAHIFPFILQAGVVSGCKLERKKRTTTSLRYHPRPRAFDEYVFPEEPDWFGAYITLAKAGADVPAPEIAYANENGVQSYRTKTGLGLRLFVTEKGDTKQLLDVDPALIPLFRTNP